MDCGIKGAMKASRRNNAVAVRYAVTPMWLLELSRQQPYCDTQSRNPMRPSCAHWKDNNGNGSTGTLPAGADVWENHCIVNCSNEPTELALNHLAHWHSSMLLLLLCLAPPSYQSQNGKQYVTLPHWLQCLYIVRFSINITP